MLCLYIGIVVDPSPSIGSTPCSSSGSTFRYTYIIRNEACFQYLERSRSTSGVSYRCSWGYVANRVVLFFSRRQMLVVRLLSLFSLVLVLVGLDELGIVLFVSNDVNKHIRSVELVNSLCDLRYRWNLPCPRILLYSSASKTLYTRWARSLWFILVDAIANYAVVLGFKVLVVTALMPISLFIMYN